jgi:hypothetical protein
MTLLRGLSSLFEGCSLKDSTSLCTFATVLFEYFWNFIVSCRSVKLEVELWEYRAVVEPTLEIVRQCLKEG